MEEKTCREACKTLNVKESGIFGGYVCYKDAQERCNQNGKNGPVASLLCKRAGTFSYLFDLDHLLLYYIRQKILENIICIIHCFSYK